MPTNSHSPQANDTDTRREMLSKSALWVGTGIAAGMVPVSRQISAAEPATKASQSVAGKSDELFVHTAFPAVLETPTRMLIKDKLTPTSLLFVRNNQQLDRAATTAANSTTDWEIRLHGLLDKSISVTLKELREMEQVSHDMVLQCSGNSRSLYAQSVKSKGTQWGRGAMGNVSFSGVPLAKILESKGATVAADAQFVTARGMDSPLPEKEDFEHSLHLDDVLARSILALDMNGAPLPAIHGGPVRLITPGIYATMHMKWLNELEFVAEETDNYNQIPRYRVPNSPITPGTKIQYTTENSRFNWAMKTKSVVLSPAPGQQVASSEVTIEGVAFNDGSCPIDTVLVSVNKGSRWHRCQLEAPSSPYAWTRFRFRVKLPPGKHTVLTRAIDSLGRSQPMDGSIHWNPSGYEWNGVEKIEFTVG